MGEQFAAENEDDLKDKMDFEEIPDYKLSTGNVTINAMLLRYISSTVWKFINFKKYLIFFSYSRTGEICSTRRR